MHAGFGVRDSQNKFPNRNLPPRIPNPESRTPEYVTVIMKHQGLVTTQQAEVLDFGLKRKPLNGTMIR